jgi:hypothetical protein
VRDGDDAERGGDTAGEEYGADGGGASAAPVPAGEVWSAHTSTVGETRVAAV